MSPKGKILFSFLMSSAKPYQVDLEFELKTIKKRGRENQMMIKTGQEIEGRLFINQW